MGKVDRLPNRVEPFAALFFGSRHCTCPNTTNHKACPYMVNSKLVQFSTKMRCPPPPFLSTVGMLFNYDCPSLWQVRGEVGWDGAGGWWAVLWPAWAATRGAGVRGALSRTLRSRGLVTMDPLQRRELVVCGNLCLKGQFFLSEFRKIARTNLCSSYRRITYCAMRVFSAFNCCGEWN